MNFGVIGPGDIGEVIIRKLRDAGYPVKMANSRGSESLKYLATKTGGIPALFRFSVKWRGSVPPLASVPPLLRRGFSRHKGLPIRCVFGKSAKGELPRSTSS